MKKQIYSNFKRQNKWMGIIDYKSLLLIIIYGIIVILLLKKIELNLKLSFYIFITFMSPLVVLLFLNTKTGSSIDILLIIIKYFLRNKIYVNMKYYSNEKCYIYINNKK